MSEDRYPDAPECDKIVEAQEESMCLSNFVDWLEQHDYTIARWVDSEYAPLAPLTISFDQLFADYFGVDLKKVEEERRAILDYVARKSQEHGEYDVEVSMSVNGEEIVPEEGEAK